MVTTLLFALALEWVVGDPANRWHDSFHLTPHHPHAICLDESYMPFSQRRALGLTKGVIRFGLPGTEADWQRLKIAITLQGEKEPSHV